MNVPSTYIIRNDEIERNCLVEIQTRAAGTGELRVRIDEKPHPKSMRQLGYVWNCLYPYLQQMFESQTGQRFDIDKAIHPYHVELYNTHKASEISEVIDLPLGYGPKIVTSAMSSWNAGPMASYIDWLLWFYANRGVSLPEADPFWKQRGIGHSKRWAA